MLVEGLLQFGENTQPFADATVRVVVEDTTYADAPSQVVARASWSEVAFAGGTGQVPFRVERPSAEPSRVYTLRVHVDMNGSGRLETGDYINAESVRVPNASVSGLVVSLKRL